ncbi:MAG: hypothetical protein ACYCV4_05440 [Dermatophilaceae bacterium]
MSTPRRHLRDYDPRFREPLPNWAGGQLLTGPQLTFSPPPEVGLYDPTVGQVVFINIRNQQRIGAKARAVRKSERLYIPRGTP